MAIGGELSEAEVRSILGKGARAQALLDAIEGGWQRHRQERRRRSDRARANVVYDYMAEIADERLATLPDVRGVKVRGLKLYVCDDTLALRLKKLDRELRPSNIPTRQQRRIERQLNIRGLPPITFLTCGYMLDLASAGVEHVFAVKHINRQREFHIDLRELARGELSPTSPILPFGPTPGEEGPALPKIMPPTEEGDSDA